MSNLTDDEIDAIAQSAFFLVPEPGTNFWLLDRWGCDGKVVAKGGVREFARALLAAAQQGAPEGWKLVPVEPTREMVDQGGRGIAFETQGFGGALQLANYSSAGIQAENRARAGAAYKQMLAATPSPQGSQHEDR